MIEEITRVVDGEEIVIGYTSLMCPSPDLDKQKMLRIKRNDPLIEDDLFLFKMIEGEWILTSCIMPIISIDDCPQLCKFMLWYMNRSSRIGFDDFVDLVYITVFLGRPWHQMD